MMAQAEADGVRCKLIPGIPHAMGVKASTSLEVATWLASELAGR